MAVCRQKKTLTNMVQFHTFNWCRGHVQTKRLGYKTSKKKFKANCKNMDLLPFFQTLPIFYNLKCLRFSFPSHIASRCISCIQFHTLMYLHATCEQDNHLSYCIFGLRNDLYHRQNFPDIFSKCLCKHNSLVQCTLAPT